MSKPLICHFLIGPPGGGKSTLAAQLAQQGDFRIVSTDQIREALYGDASIQGEWQVIEEQVLAQILAAMASGQPVIYDATNVQRSWRVAILKQLNLHAPPCLWIAWHLQTPLETCKAWNQKRKRRVPEEVIERMFNSLQEFPPVPTEGFAVVNSGKITSDGFISLSLS